MRKDIREQKEIQKKIYSKPEIENIGSLTNVTKGRTAVKYDTGTPGNTYSTVQ